MELQNSENCVVCKFFIFKIMKISEYYNVVSLGKFNLFYGNNGTPPAHGGGGGGDSLFYCIQSHNQIIFLNNTVY